MYELNRRKFLKLLGQGTAVLSVGISGSTLLTHTGCSKGNVSSDIKGDYQIFYPGEYSDSEKRALTQFKSSFPLDLLGRPYEVSSKEALPEIISSHNSIVNPRNPLYNEERYAKETRFGEIYAICKVL